MMRSERRREKDGKKVNSFLSIWLSSKHFLFILVYFLSPAHWSGESTRKRTVTNKIQLNFFSPQSHKLTLLCFGDLKFSKWNHPIVKHCIDGGKREREGGGKHTISILLFLLNFIFRVQKFDDTFIFMLFIGCQWKAVVIMFIYSQLAAAPMTKTTFWGKLVQTTNFSLLFPRNAMNRNRAIKFSLCYQ